MKAHNNPMNSLTTFAGTHTRGAAAPLCPTCLRPLLESYKPKGNIMKKEILITCLSLLSANSYAAKNDAAELAIKFQHTVNQGNYVEAIRYWEPSKQGEMSINGGQLIGTLFSGISLQKDTMDTHCSNENCIVSAQYTDEYGEPRKITYTFVKNGSLFLSNIQTTGS